MRVINRLLIFDVISFLRHRRPNCGGFPIESAVSFPLIKSACRKPILSFVRWSLTKRQASGTAPRGPRDVSRWLLFEIASHQSGTAGAYADVFPSNQPFRSVICRRLHSDSDRGVYTKQPPPRNVTPIQILTACRYCHRSRFNISLIVCHRDLLPMACICRGFIHTDLGSPITYGTTTVSQPVSHLLLFHACGGPNRSCEINERRRGVMGGRG